MEAERDEWGFVPLAHMSRKELVVWSKMEIDGGEEESSQFDLIRARFSATQFLYASIPESFQWIFTLSLLVLGASGLSGSGGRMTISGRERSESRAS